MENCLKRREHGNGSDVEDGEDSDLESDLEASLTVAERSRHPFHEYDCGLISPYKRLRVEDLTHTSAESQGGEGEAHSLLRSHDDGEDDFYARNFDKSLASTSCSINTENLSQEKSSRNLVLKSSPKGSPVPSASGGQDDPRRFLSEKEVSCIQRYCETMHGSSHSYQPDDFENRGSIPYIDSICMDEDPFISADEREFPPPPAVDKSKKSVRTSRPVEYDSLLLASYHPDFQTLESRQISYHSDVHKLGLSPINKFKYHFNQSPQILSNSASSGPHGIKYSGSLDLLEIHAGNVSLLHNRDPDGGNAQNVSHNTESSKSGERQRIIMEASGTSADNKATHRQTEQATSNAGAGYIELSDSLHHSDNTNSISKCGFGPNQSDNSNSSHSKSVGTSCMNPPAQITARPSEMDYATQGSATVSSQRTSTRDDISCVYDTVDSETDHNEGSRSSGQKSAGSSLVKSTASLGVSTAGLHELSNEGSTQRSRFSSQNELSANSHSLGSSFEWQAHGTKATSLDSIHQYPQQYQQPQQHQASLRRQHSSGSSRKSHASSSHSHCPETYEMYIHEARSGELRPHLAGARNSAAYSQSRSHSSKHRSKGEIRGSRSKNYNIGSLQYSSDAQQCSEQQQSSWSSHHYSRSSHGSQGSQGHKERSYPSSLAISGHQGKKAVLQSSGHLKVSAYWNVGLLTVHVIQARCLSSSWKSHCDSYVKMSLVPDESRRTRCKTQLQHNSNNPVYDEKFSMEILEEDRRKRLLISVWHKDQGNGASEFLGCMSFGVQNLLKKDLDGWYYLLTEEIGRKKHLQAHTKPVMTARSYQNIPHINKAVDGQERIVINIPRGKNGFGFSFVDELPPKVGRVDRASPAEQAGVKKGDLVIRINGQNVSRSTCEGVAHMVKKMNPQMLTLELQRDHVVSTTTEITATGTQHPHHAAPYNKRGVGTSTDHLYESITEKSSGDHHKENRAVNRTFDDEEYITDEDMSQHPRQASHPGITSTPRPFVAQTHKTVSTQALPTMTKHESIHRLMSMELDNIDFMHYGIERYSRPLRHCIVSAHQHLTIFQNVEKLVTISEYHIKQMQDNNSSVNSDTDDSQSSESSMFPNSIALIYQSKIHMLCQAYETYANGLVRSNALLRELRKNRDFMNFIKEPASDDGQPLGHPSISAFINRPVLHIQELHTVLSEIFAATPLHSPDFVTLQQIVIKLSQCVTAITGLDSAGRVQSLDSLTSSQGRTSSQTTSSGKGSMASLSSASSEADAQRPLLPSSAASVKSMNRDVLRIQDRLVFPPNIQAFQLCQEERHLIYQGDIFRCHKGSWFKSQLLLFSDILLIVVMETDGTLLVQDNPVSMLDLAGIEINRKYASEFVLHLHAATSATLPRRQHSSASASSKSAAANSGYIKTLTLRAPSSQEKFVWKSLLDQRVAAFNGSKLQHYGSMKDISNVKTNIIL